MRLRSTAKNEDVNMDSNSILGNGTVTSRKHRFEAKTRDNVDNFIHQRIVEALSSPGFDEEHVKSLFTLAKEYENPWLSAAIGLFYLNEKCTDTSNAYLLLCSCEAEEFYTTIIKPAFFPFKLNFTEVNLSKTISKHVATQESVGISEIYRKFIHLCDKGHLMKAKFPNVNAEGIMRICKNSGTIKSRALACNRHIFVHVIKKRFDNEGAKNKYLLNDEYLTAGEKRRVNTDITHVLELGVGKDIETVIEPKDDQSQIHVVIDLELAKIYMAGSLLLLEMTLTGTCKPDRVDQFHPGCVVSVTTYNFYSLHDVNMNVLLNTHVENIRTSAANHNPINCTSMEASIGKLIGLSGPCVDHSNGLIRQFCYKKGAQSSLHLMAIVCHIWPEMYLSWRKVTLDSRVPGMLHGVGSTQYAGVSYIVPLHLDNWDISFTTSFTMEKNTHGNVPHGEKGRSASMYIANYKLLIHTDAPSVSIWQGACDLHTTTYTPYKCTKDSWESVGMVSLFQRHMLSAAEKGKFNSFDFSEVDKRSKSTSKPELEHQMDRICRMAGGDHTQLVECMPYYFNGRMMQWKREQKVK
ncbi:hypothetical protein BDQ17DRAFT_1432907 [Cyathus striatus]|nr:hypothetical protein BDQ17DRAFT_1432907 [Cyathus striatus]